MHLDHVDTITDLSDSYKLAISHILSCRVARKLKVSLFAQDRRRGKGICVEQKAIVLVATAKDSNRVVVYHRDRRVGPVSESTLVQDYIPQGLLVEFQHFDRAVAERTAKDVQALI